MARATDRRIVDISVPGVGVLQANLTGTVPGAPMVVFAHGTGSGRNSPRNKAVAERLNAEGFGTLLLDLMTDVEQEAQHSGGGPATYSVDDLATRLVAAVDWTETQPHRPASIGYFAASTGAAGALVAAAWRGQRISAVVSRAGRPDLAGDVLPLVSAPTLLIVGDRDPLVEVNKQAQNRLVCESHLEIIPGVTHLFEEAGALERVAELAAVWFGRHLRRDTHP